MPPSAAGLDGTMNWNRTARLCRRDQAALGHMVSSGRFLKLHFITDSSVTSRGFRAILNAGKVPVGRLTNVQYCYSIDTFPLLANLYYCIYSISKCDVCVQFAAGI